MLVAAAGGCASYAPVVREDVSFDSRSPTAMLVVSGPPITLQNTIFRGVDIQAQLFNDASVVITTGGAANVINLDDPSSFWVTPPAAGFFLSMVEVEPGDYALVTLAEERIGYPMTTRSWLCVAPAPVFRLAPGEIVVVSTAPWWRNFGGSPNTYSPDASTVAQEFERVRGRYPGISGELQFPVPVALIDWQAATSSPFMSADGSNCAEPETFSVIDAKL